MSQYFSPERFAEAERHLKPQISILAAATGLPTCLFSKASIEDDRAFGTDVNDPFDSYSLRIRDFKYKHRYQGEFTIRLSPDLNGVSEWDKIRAGTVRW